MVKHDPRGCGSSACFVNHSCQPNSELELVYIDGYWFVFITAIVDMKAGDEITVDYGYQSLMDYCVLICSCHGKNCRGTV